MLASNQHFFFFLEEGKWHATGIYCSCKIYTWFECLLSMNCLVMWISDEHLHGMITYRLIKLIDYQGCTLNTDKHGKYCACLLRNAAYLCMHVCMAVSLYMHMYGVHAHTCIHTFTHTHTWENSKYFPFIYMISKCLQLCNCT